MSRARRPTPGAARARPYPALGPASLAATLSLGVLLGAGSALGVSRAAGPRGHAARTFSLRETGDLHVTGKRGFVLDEQGPVSGTVAGTLSVRLTIISTSRVSAEVDIRRTGGSITGFGTASYQRGTDAATFSGSMSIERGTGTYSHAHGSGLSLSGSIARSNEAITVHVRGRVSD